MRKAKERPLPRFPEDWVLLNGLWLPPASAAICPSPANHPAQPPRFTHKRLENGRVATRIELGEFASLREAERVAYETTSDLAWQASWKQIQAEITASTSLGDETLEQMLDDHLRQQCNHFAAQAGLIEVWKESQTWCPNFQKAWAAWRIAWDRWLGGSRRFPETKGPAMNWYLWARKHFLAHTRLGRGNLPEFYKHWDWFIFIAARLGDVEFFKDFALAKRHKVEPRNVQYWLMLAWMPAALWSCNQDAVAKLLHKRCNAWGNNPPAKRGEAVRRGWQLLRLGPSRDEDYRIADFNSNWQPVLRG